MKLSPEKQKHLVMAIVIVVVVNYVAWNFLVQGQRSREVRDRKEIERLTGEVKKTEQTIQKEKNDREQAKAYQAYVAISEEKMVKGNAETWMLKTLSDMARAHGIDITNAVVQDSQVKELGDYKFKGQPYKLVGFWFEFKGDFNQIGKFLMDMENTLPFMEVDELSISTGSKQAPYIHSVSLRVSMVTKT